MSINVSSNQITSDSGKIFFKEGSKSIEVRENQVFITNKFISCGSYIFTKGLVLPLARICIDAREAPNSTVILDFASLTMMDGEGNPSTFSQIVSYVPKDNISAVLLDSSIARAYQISVARSGIGNTNAELAQNEITHFVESGGFDVSYYNKDNSAPSILLNNQTLPYNDTNLTCTANNTSISFTVNENINYITLSIQF